VLQYVGLLIVVRVDLLDLRATLLVESHHQVDLSVVVGIASLARLPLAVEVQDRVEAAVAGRVALLAELATVLECRDDG
jgi:hypothetical protein